MAGVCTSHSIMGANREDIPWGGQVLLAEAERVFLAMLVLAILLVLVEGMQANAQTCISMHQYAWIRVRVRMQNRNAFECIRIRFNASECVRMRYHVMRSNAFECVRMRSNALECV